MLLGPGQACRRVLLLHPSSWVDGTRMQTHPSSPNPLGKVLRAVLTVFLPLWQDGGRVERRGHSV